MSKHKPKHRQLSFQSLEKRELLTTFYVDDATGSDSNDGLSLGNAFKTIQAGADAAFAGDTVLIRGGTYREEVSVPRSGNSSDPIVFQAYNNEEVVISGADLVTGWTNFSGDVWVATAAWNAGGNRENNTLFVDGVLQQEARQGAETNFFDIDDWGLLPKNNLVNNASSFAVNDLGSFSDDFWNGAKIKFHTHDWVVATRTITDFDQSSGTITLDTPVGIVSVKQDEGYYIYDTLNAVDEPGEWYKQDGGDSLYYQVSPGQDPNTMEIELKNRAFAFNLESNDYIHIKDIEFRGVSIDTDSNTDSNLYEGNHFYAYDVNNYGRFFVTGDNNILRDNEFSHVWGAIASVGGVRNDFINNYIHHIGYSPTARVISAAGAEEMLFSHNTVSTFARSFMDGYPTRSEIAYNVFEDGGNLSWDTGMFDADGTNGDSSYSIFHHNILRNTETRGIFEGFYGRNSNAVIHHNLFYNFNELGNRTVFRSYGSEFRQAYHNTFITDLNSAPSGNLDAIESIQTRYNNNLQITMEDMAALGVDIRGNYNYSASDFVNFTGDNYQLDAGSAAIDTGILIPGINDSYLGSAPDPGAFEFGEAAWTAGHNFVIEPNPVYSWTALPGTNIYNNGQFLEGIGDWTIDSGTPASEDRNSWNLGPSGASLTGSFRTESVELEPGEAMSRTFTGLTPNTTYTLGAAVRVVNKITIANQYDGSLGSITTGTHRDEQYVTNLSGIEWVRYDDINFGSAGQFDQIDLLHIRNPALLGQGVSLDGVTVEVRLDSPTGTLLAEFADLTDGSAEDRWRADRTRIDTISGVHSIYVSIGGANSNNLALGSFRLLNESPPTSDLLSVKITSTGAETISAMIGEDDWEVYYEEVTFTTGPSATTANVQFANNGRMNAYLDRVYLIEGYATRGQQPVDLTSGATAELSLTADTSTSAPGVLDTNLNNLNQTGDHPNSWIQVDLGDSRAIHSIKLSPSNSQLDQLSNFRVSVWSDDPRSGGTELWNQDFLTDGQSQGTSESLLIHSKTLGLDGQTELRDVTGQFVRIQLLGQNNNGNNQLSLGEVQINGFGENNWAITDGTASQSTTSAGLVATNAIDGDPTTHSATDVGATNSWWQVSLPQGFGIGEIELVNVDTATFAELSNFTVSVWDDDPNAGGTLIWDKAYFSTGSVGQGDSLIIDGGEIGDDGMTRLNTAHRGRYVRVQLDVTNNEGNGRLSLAEFRISASNNTVPESNVAQSGIATQSRDWYGDQRDNGFAADANDGVILPVSQFSTSYSEPQAWWQVDMQRATQIDQIVVFNRVDAAERLNNFTVSVWDDDPDNGGTNMWDRTYFYSSSAPFYSTTNIGAGGALLINGNVLDGGLALDSHSNARYVRIQLNGTDFLSLPEVQVWSNSAPLGENQSVNLAASQYDYDFGSPVSPVGSGYTKISPITSGDISWSGDVAARDAGNTAGVTDVNQDLVYSSTQRTLHHNIANGVWQVTVTMGEVGRAHDNMRVFAEGALLDGDVDSSDGQFVDVVSGLIQVTDGVLDVTFDQMGGVDGEWVVNRLSLTKIGDEHYILLDPAQTTFDYDVGTSTSPVESGYDRISDLTNGDVTWSSTVLSNDRASGGDVDRDFVYGSAPVTLEHPVPAGVWDVTVRVGDMSAPRDDVSISAEGLVQIADIDTVAGQIAEYTFRVEVSDGGLSLLLEDNGGDPFWVLNQISFTKINDLPIAAGDFNADQQIDDTDLVQWQSEYGTDGAADADLDRKVTGLDFLAWQRNFGVGVATETTLIDSSTRNGSFEDHTGSTGLAVNESLQRALSTGGTPATIPSWTLNATTGIGGWEAADPNVASDGTAYAFANDSADFVLTSEVMSSFVTAAGDEFTLHFDAGSDTGGAHIYEARLIFGGTTRVIGSVVDTTTVSGSPAESLTTHTFNYTAVAGDAGFSPVLELFVDNQGGISKSYLDNVVLIGSKPGPQPLVVLSATPEPEPATSESAINAPVTVEILASSPEPLAGIAEVATPAPEQEQVVVASAVDVSASPEGFSVALPQTGAFILPQPTSELIKNRKTQDSSSDVIVTGDRFPEIFVSINLVNLSLPERVRPEISSQDLVSAAVFVEEFSGSANQSLPNSPTIDRIGRPLEFSSIVEVDSTEQREEIESLDNAFELL